MPSGLYMERQIREVLPSAAQSAIGLCVSTERCKMTCSMACCRQATCCSSSSQAGHRSSCFSSSSPYFSFGAGIAPQCSRHRKLIAANRSRTVLVQAADKFEAGQRVRVAKPVTVYHAPKAKEGMNLEGKEGTVVGVVTHYKGKELTANLPFKVQFELEGDSKPVKFFAHLDEPELEAA